MWAEAIVKPYVVTFRTSMATATPPPLRSLAAASDDRAADAMPGSLIERASRSRLGASGGEAAWDGQPEGVPARRPGLRRRRVRRRRGRERARPRPRSGRRERLRPVRLRDR